MAQPRARPQATYCRALQIGLHVDIAPTILTLAGVDLAGKGIDGTPLALVGGAWVKQRRGGTAQRQRLWVRARGGASLGGA